MNKEIFDKLSTDKKKELIKWTCEAETINSVNKDTLRAMVQFMWIWFEEIDLEKNDGYAITKEQYDKAPEPVRNICNHFDNAIFQGCSCDDEAYCGVKKKGE